MPQPQPRHAPDASNRADTATRTPHVAHLPDIETTTLYDLLRLRCDIFVVEQHCPYPELDGRDAESATLHLWHDHDGAPIAYLRILQDPDGCARIGRLCVAAPHRGGGHAGRLLIHALHLIGPHTDCRLEAQAHLATFYARFGFVATGPEYLEDGIPHVPMVRSTDAKAEAGVSTDTGTTRR
jgi:ElaA protein